MSFHSFSIPNLCLVLLSAGLIVYYLRIWQLVKQKAPQQEFQLFKKPVRGFAAVYTAFMLLLCLLATNQFFQAVTTPPRFLFVFVPLLLSVIVLSRAEQSGALSFLPFIPPAMLVFVHVYRLFIELAFIQFANEKIIPVELSIHGRNYDLWIGVLAIPFGYLVSRQTAWAKKGGTLFNILGLLSLVNIFTIVIPAMPSPFRVYEPMQLAAYFPGVLIVFLASSAIFLHILSLRQLLAFKPQTVTPSQTTTLVIP
ncbi:hypothetical protein HRH25_05895 [Flavisolibacter sp. BT320]|nr:hypothetical protein [Flavisolibacter longurius]